MLVVAALMIGFQIIDIRSAFRSINLDVIGFLFGMFSIVSALDTCASFDYKDIHYCMYDKS
jgi:Na+/H+ antiporter NhaD/arsenite permease-like protein